MLVYGTDTATDRCNIFETLVPEWKYPKLRKYMLQDINLQQRDRSQWDQSLSYRKMMINQDTACMFACCYDNKGGHLPAHSAKPAIFQ